MTLPFHRRYNMLNRKGLHSDKSTVWRLVQWVVILFLLAIIFNQHRAMAALAPALEDYKTRLDLAEANLRGCMNGGYTGIYRFRADNKRVEFQCDAKAYEVTW